jgi:beta-ureidopropionase / N-carbamoyl-L-amino-acid hydrolase
MAPLEGLCATTRVNSERLWASLMALAEIGATARGGCNRQALTEEDRRGRDVFVGWARDAGCSVRIDEIGNIFAVRSGDEPHAPAVLMGSHLDTQATGGRFDGVYGVMAGLEVIRTLNDLGIRTRRPIEVASWTNEEGCRFAPAMLGSGVVAGVYDLAFAYSRKDRAGVELGQELARLGYLGAVPARQRPLHAALEVHIEQGPILEESNTKIGVVTGIQGAYWLDVTLEGVAAHAGSTPMELRRDPWRVACPLIETAYEIAKAYAPWARATIGDLKISPGSRNTVPERLVVSVDLRHPRGDTLKSMVEQFKRETARMSLANNITARVDEIWHMPPTDFDARLLDLVDNAAQALGLSRRRMVSGAGHDSLHTAQFAPTAMIFIPCAGGLSHNEGESASPEDLAAGADVLLQVAVKAANE